MILYIDTTKGDEVEVALKINGKTLAGKKFKARYSQAEKLLPEINKLLKRENIKKKDLTGIEVANQGESDKTSFTSLRIGVATANVLGYALGIPVIGEKGRAKTIKNKNNKKINIIEPIYDKEPNITVRKKIGV